MTVTAAMPGMTIDQQHLYIALADAIEHARLAGKIIGCVTFPRLFDRHRERGWNHTGQTTTEAEEHRLRAAMCGRCPAFKHCEAYRDSGVDQEGYLAVTLEHAG